MDKLPKEIIALILKNLPQKDLLNAACVSKDFNGIISTFGLIEKIYIKNADFDLSPPTRNYSKAVIKKDNPVQFCKAFESIGNGITEIYFNNLSISLKTIVDILNLLPNLKLISFYYTRLVNEDEGFKEKVNPLHGINLIFSESNPIIFKVFDQISIDKIDLSFFGDTPYYNFSDMLPFMKNQQKLKSFKMSGIYESNLMFGIVPRGDYKLTEFCISGSDLEEWHYLESFLADHTDTLETLSVIRITSWDCSNVIKSCKALKKLILHETMINELNDSILTVEELSIQLPMENITRFPNVKKLHVQQSNVEINTTLSRSMQYVTDLTLQFSPADGILMPNITNLELINVTQLERSFFDQHKSIKHLILRNTFNIEDNLLEAVAKNLGHSMRTLKIFGLNNLTAKAFEIIRENCTSLKSFEMATWSQKFKNDEWKCLYAINGLKIYTEKFDF